MTVRFRTRLVGAAGALALVGGAIGVTSPAEAASATLTYTCTSPALGAPSQFTAVFDTDAPAKIAYGETVTPTVTGTVTVPENVTATIRDTIMAKKVDGKADVAATVDEVARPWSLAIPQTNVPPSGTMTLEGTGSAGTFAGAVVGTVYDIATGNFTATLNFYQANGSPTVPPSATMTCALNPGQNAAVDTIKVVKDSTTTQVNARDINKGGKAKAKVTVVSDHGKTVKGKIRAKLVRHGNVLMTKVLSLKDGKRRVSFLRLYKEDTYKVKVKYLGHQNFKGSRGSDTFQVH
jgi:hypothetical protein